MCLLEYNQICSNGSIDTKPLERFVFIIWLLVYHYYLLRSELIKSNNGRVYKSKTHYHTKVRYDYFIKKKQ